MVFGKILRGVSRAAGSAVKKAAGEAVSRGLDVLKPGVKEIGGQAGAVLRGLGSHLGGQAKDLVKSTVKSALGFRKGRRALKAHKKGRRARTKSGRFRKKS